MAKKDGSCIHLKDNLCSIYGIRPDICRTKPYNTDEEKILACKQINKEIGNEIATKNS